jgi:hypothetical protein
MAGFKDDVIASSVISFVRAALEVWRKRCNFVGRTHKKIQKHRTC